MSRPVSIPSMAAAVAAPHPSGAACAMLQDGRWHFQHGPIDLVIGVDGSSGAVQAAIPGAWQRFTQILPELAGELARLRRPAGRGTEVQGPVAARMLTACRPYAAQVFVTPMAAVAGSVADELIGFFSAQAGIERAYINNGGDIALHIGPGRAYRIGLFSDLGRVGRLPLGLDGAFEITAGMPVRGVATSGWRGRSFSLGIADSVTVLAADAAQADVAATLVANQVFVDHAAVRRAPADTLKDDTDLGSRLVTVDVGPLPRTAIDQALGLGAAYAQRLCDDGSIHGAVLMLQGSVRTVGIACGPGALESGPRPPTQFKAMEGRASLSGMQRQKESHV
ncbi:UPF0280 family protein [Pusillimonas sp.]|uniref:UPF0280 family protein n=1 Tax=Pusillimonas sp. TaxID=3040095 RepID=UPI0029A9A3C4|nr:UPF0280 family protein [Pusillimonas sp.]MDX3894468.1 UPF0280 family protein [Pusillimonas sp.]